MKIVRDKDDALSWDYPFLLECGFQDMDSFLRHPSGVWVDSTYEPAAWGYTDVDGDIVHLPLPENRGDVRLLLAALTCEGGMT